MWEAILSVVGLVIVGVAGVRWANYKHDKALETERMPDSTLLPETMTMDELRTVMQPREKR